MGEDDQPGVTAAARIDLADHATSAGTARAAVTEFCQRWHLSELIDTAALLVSELVTNAVRHAAPPVRLYIARPGTDLLHVEVADNRPHPPQPDLHPDTESPGGRGLFIVDSLATRSGHRSTGHGKSSGSSSRVNHTRAGVSRRKSAARWWSATCVDGAAMST